MKQTQQHAGPRSVQRNLLRFTCFPTPQQQPPVHPIQRQSNTPVSLQDLYPTLYEYCISDFEGEQEGEDGASLPEYLDGVSIRNILEPPPGGTVDTQKRGNGKPVLASWFVPKEVEPGKYARETCFTVIGEYPPQPEGEGEASPIYQYIRYSKSDLSDMRFVQHPESDTRTWEGYEGEFLEELYDITNDPLEMINRVYDGYSADDRDSINYLEKFMPPAASTPNPITSWHCQFHNNCNTESLCDMGFGCGEDYMGYECPINAAYFAPTDALQTEVGFTNISSILDQNTEGECIPIGEEPGVEGECVPLVAYSIPITIYNGNEDGTADDNLHLCTGFKGNLRFKKSIPVSDTLTLRYAGKFSVTRPDTSPGDPVRAWDVRYNEDETRNLPEDDTFNICFISKPDNCNENQLIYGQQEIAYITVSFYYDAPEGQADPDAHTVPGFQSIPVPFLWLENCKIQKKGSCRYWIDCQTCPVRASTADCLKITPFDESYYIEPPDYNPELTAVPDVRLRARIIELMPSGKAGWKCEAEDIKELDASYYGIRNLKGMEYLTSLQTLILDGNNQIADISRLSSLTTLTTLSMKGCTCLQIYPDNPIKNLLALEVLDMSGVLGSSVTPFSSLNTILASNQTNLHVLKLSGCINLIDSGITILEQLSGINEVDLSCCTSLTNLQPLVNNSSFRDGDILHASGIPNINVQGSTVYQQRLDLEGKGVSVIISETCEPGTSCD